MEKKTGTIGFPSNHVEVSNSKYLVSFMAKSEKIWKKYKYDYLFVYIVKNSFFLSIGSEFC